MAEIPIESPTPRPYWLPCSSPAPPSCAPNMKVGWETKADPTTMARQRITSIKEGRILKFIIETLEPKKLKNNLNLFS